MLRCAQGDTKAMPSDVFGWLDRVTSGSQEAMLDFCSQWVQTCPHMLQQNESGCHPFKYAASLTCSISPAYNGSVLGCAALLLHVIAKITCNQGGPCILSHSQVKKQTAHDWRVMQAGIQFISKCAGCL